METIKVKAVLKGLPWYLIACIILYICVLPVYICIENHVKQDTGNWLTKSVIWFISI